MSRCDARRPVSRVSAVNLFCHLGDVFVKRVGGEGKREGDTERSGRKRKTKSCLRD